VIRRLESDEVIQHEEADRMAAKAKASKRAKEWLKQYTVKVMDEHGWKHLKTALNTLTIRGNGGVQPLVIDAPEKVPDELCWMEGRIRADLWASLLAYISSDASYRMERVPSNTLIREALTKVCSRCDGVGKYCPNCGDVPCLELETCATVETAVCHACEGTGRVVVPGAHLEPRGRQLRLS
jgi:Siphovirus Gp157